MAFQQATLLELCIYKRKGAERATAHADPEKMLVNVTMIENCVTQ